MLLGIYKILIKVLKPLKPIIPENIIKKHRHLAAQVTNFRTLAKTYGQYRSIVLWSCVDKENNPIPWYTYPAVEYLRALDFRTKRVLEWGSGNSSLFWATEAQKVVSVEHDKDWFEKMHPLMASNQNIYLKPLSGGGGNPL